MWFIAMAQWGFNRELSIAALERGDVVVAAVPDTSALNDLEHTFGAALIPIAVDLTDRRAVVDAVARSHRQLGRLDVVVTGAGYVQWGFIEELTEKQVRHQMDLNCFAALWVTQAALPYLRAQRSGHIIAICPPAGMGAVPNAGVYLASKRALQGFSEALAQEVAPCGVDVTVIEDSAALSERPNASVRKATMLPAYGRGHLAADRLVARLASRTENPRRGVLAVLDVVDLHNVARRPPIHTHRASREASLVDG